jgi:hypothetical protein
MNACENVASVTPDIIKAIIENIIKRDRQLNKMKRQVVITNDILERGCSSNGGWSNRQMALLGINRNRNSGWKKTLIGSKVSAKNVRQFLSLKNAHLEKRVKNRFAGRDYNQTNETTIKALAILKQFGGLQQFHNLCQQEVDLIYDYARLPKFTPADLKFLENMRDKIARIGFIN